MKNLCRLAFALVIAETPFAAPDTTHSNPVDTLTVTGRKSPTQERLVVEQEEKQTGLTDDVNKLLVLKPGIIGVPEAGSSLLVHGESPFDNMFQTYSVPTFAPSHFSNNTFCDHSATMISTVKTVRLVTDQLAGRYAGASASVIATDPGISRPANAMLIPRPELSIGIGALCQDISLSLPARKGADLYQLSVTNTDSYKISWLGLQSRSSEQAALGYGMPSTFGDGVFTATHSLNRELFREYLLFAWDNYQPSIHGPAMTVPWGIGAVSFEDTLRDGVFKITAGGSRQQYYEGKKYVYIIPLDHVERTNATLKAELCRVQEGSSLYDVSVQTERLEWNGQQTILPNARQTQRELDSLGLAKQESVHETEVQVHAGGQRSTGRLAMGANILVGGIAPWYRLYADPGLWLKLQYEKWSTGISAGITTTRPDIRGLPVYEYRGSLEKTYSVSVNGQTAPARWLDLSLDAYVKWKDRCPARSLTPGNLVWDPSLESPLLIGGAAPSVILSLLEHWQLTTMLDLNEATRTYKSGSVPYEWNVPFSGKSILRYRALSGRMQFFLIGFYSTGLPYREIYISDSGPAYAASFSRVPDYKRVDFKIQFYQPIERLRFLTRFDGYVEVCNVFDWPNIREYYYDFDMAKLPVFLERFGINMGMRLGFRM
ncbi:MAG TPA: hypothetical protein VLX68_00525 [Chitinivibrionales bacterium]|nr:hypothetical protein [Chitinivibrionales bacterium]